MTNGSELSKIAVAPTWALESTFDGDAEVILHTREGEVAFTAQTDLLERPQVPQHLRLQAIDRLQFQGTDGLGCVRDAVVDVILVQEEPEYPDGIEVATWDIDEARKLYKALGDLLDAYDAAGAQ